MSVLLSTAFRSRVKVSLGSVTLSPRIGTVHLRGALTGLELQHSGAGGVVRVSDAAAGGRAAVVGGVRHVFAWLTSPLNVTVNVALCVPELPSFVDTSFTDATGAGGV